MDALGFRGSNAMQVETLMQARYGTGEVASREPQIRRHQFHARSPVLGATRLLSRLQGWQRHGKIDLCCRLDIHI